MMIPSIAAAFGALAGSAFSCIPGLHIYGPMGLIALWMHSAGGAIGIPPDALIAGSIGMVVGFAVVNSIPSILLSAPDDSALFVVLPGQKLLMAGRGFEAVYLTGVGSAVGLVLLIGGVVPAGAKLLPGATRVLGPHLHWILWCVIAFMLLSEWPKSTATVAKGLRRLLLGWRSVGAGLFTFILSGWLGFLLMYRSPVPLESAFQNLMPAFVGLFTVPWLVLNLLARVELPAQHAGCGRRPSLREILLGGAAGGMGGGFAAFFPGVTGGVGGMLAGHATAQRDDRQFLIAQGASKFIYYAGGLLLLFVPGLHITRGGAAGMLTGLHDPRLREEFGAACVATVAAGLVSLALLLPLTRAVLWTMRRWGYQRVSMAALAMAVALVAGITGLPGLLVMGAGTAIGLIPPLFGSRRMNCLGVILLPMACNMSGVGGRVAEWLGLV